MTEVNKVQMSTGKKVAIGLGTAAAIGLTAAAYLKGKKVNADTFHKTAEGVAEKAKKLDVVKSFVKTIGKGYKEIGNSISKTVKEAVENIGRNAETVKSRVNRMKQNTAAREAEKAANAVEEAIQKQ